MNIQKCFVILRRRVVALNPIRSAAQRFTPLVVAIVASGFVSSIIPARAVEREIVALWLFDEVDHPSTMLSDAGPNYWDLRLDTKHGQLVSGRFGNAIKANGSSGVATRWAMGIDRKDSRIIPFPYAARELIRTFAGGDWTLEFWLRLDERPTEKAVIVAIGTKQEPPLFEASISRGGSPFVIRGTNPRIEFQCPTVPAVLADGKWHHVAFVFNRANCELNHFVDGKPLGFGMPKVAKANGDSQLGPGLVVLEHADLMLASPISANEVEAIEWSGSGEAGSKQFIGYLTAPTGEEISFDVESESGARLELNGAEVVERCDGTNPVSRSVRLEAGKPYAFQLETFHPNAGAQGVALYWSWPGQTKQLIPATAFSHSPIQSEAFGEDAKVYNQAKKKGFVISIARDAEGESAVNGEIDELCFSRGATYGAEFTPVSFAKPAQSADSFRATGPRPLALDSVAAAYDFGKRKHVFIDGMLVDVADGVSLRVNPPILSEATDLRRDRPWDALYDESGVASKLGDPVTMQGVYDHNGKVRIAYSNGGLWSRAESMLSLAESADGLHFDKPAIGRTKWRGSLQNNILLLYPGQGGFMVDSNPSTPSNEKIKFFCFGMERGVHLFTSPDGINFCRSGTTSLCSDVGGGVEPFWDDQVGEYRIYLRHEGFVRGNRGADGRAAFLVRVQDPARQWPVPKLKNAEPDKITEEYPIPFKPDESGQVYRTQVIKYPWAADTYLAFPWRMIGDHVIMQTELATSRNGIDWTFLGIKPAYISVQEEKGKALAINGLVRRGDEIWQFADIQDSKNNAIHRFRQRLDGFTCYSTGKSKPGSLLTKPIIFSGGALSLNVSARGQVRVAIVNADGTEIPGFELEKCQQIKGDTTHVPVEWEGDAKLSSLAGYVVRLKFHMEDADLYAFEFE
jgi:hypothetical protein